MTNDEILVAVSEALVEIAGDEILIAGPVTMTTSFNGDLELESIEFVALAERVRARYGAGVDFAGWLASMDLEQILALRVGQLVELIVRCDTRRATA